MKERKTNPRSTVETIAWFQHSFPFHPLFSGLEKHFSKTDADIVFTFGEEIRPKEICKSYTDTKVDKKVEVLSNE